MKTTTLLSSLLALTPAFAIPPDSFGFPVSQNGTPLSLTYQINGSALRVQPGNLFGISVPTLLPTIAVNESYKSTSSAYTGQYIFFMVDPDASYPENPTNRFIIHCWQENLTKSTSRSNDSSIGGTALVNSTAPRVAYRSPAPPTNSSAHRYIQYLFEQPANYQVPDAFAGYSGKNASKFPFEKFLSAANLAAPVAANYFYASNQSVVPSLFVAAPGQMYPGGNGGMITQGTNLPSSTAAGSSATSSATGAAAPATYSGAASSLLSAKGEMLVLVVALASWLHM